MKHKLRYLIIPLVLLIGFVGAVKCFVGHLLEKAGRRKAVAVANALPIGMV